jgi:hypothetical protein
MIRALFTWFRRRRPSLADPRRVFFPASDGHHVFGFWRRVTDDDRSARRPGRHDFYSHRAQRPGRVPAGWRRG